jgi:DME family drug/metabolite transporter
MSTVPASSSPAPRSRSAGFAFILGAALSWSLAGLGIKSVPLSALGIVSLRALFALPVFAFVLWFRVRSDLPAVLRLGLSRWQTWVAALSYAFTMLSFVLASKLTTSANAILLQYTAPIYVILLSRPLLGERVGRADVLAVLGCFLGIGWFFLEQLSTSGLYGNLLALLSGASLGLLPLLLRRAEQPPPAASAQTRERLVFVPTVVLLLGNVLAALVGAPAALTGPWPEPVSWLWLAVLGVVQIALAYLLYAAGVRRLRAVESLMLASLEPILNPLWVALGTGERPSRAALCGGLLILLSVIGHGLHTTLRPKPPR